MDFKTINLAPLIDHTCLKADATQAEVQLLCQQALEFGFATVCVNSYWIPWVSELLSGSAVKPITVVGFPLGANLISVKASEAAMAIDSGAREIDMVMNIGALKSGDLRVVSEDMERVVQASGPYPVKVIIETALLDREQKILACQLSVDAGAAFVKTSTGFSTGGATVEDIRLMREIVGPQIGVKASGGIKTRAEAIALVEAGANRLGASSSVQLL